MAAMHCNTTNVYFDNFTFWSDDSQKVPLVSVSNLYDETV
jgi:hypothetical protein